MPLVREYTRKTRPRQIRQRIPREHPKNKRTGTERVLPLNPLISMRKVTLSLLGICCASILTIWLKIQIDVLSGDISVLEQNIMDQESKNRYSAQELDKATSYDFIYAIVNSNSNMDLPENPKVILTIPDEMLYQDYR